MSKDGWFYRLCAALDTPGGHMIFCFSLIVLGTVMCKIGLDKQGDTVIGGAVGAGLMAMRGLNGRSLQPKPPEPSNPVASTDTKTKT